MVAAASEEVVSLISDSMEMSSCDCPASIAAKPVSTGTVESCTEIRYCSAVRWIPAVLVIALMSTLEVRMLTCWSKSSAPNQSLMPRLVVTTLSSVGLDISPLMLVMLPIVRV